MSYIERSDNPQCLRISPPFEEPVYFLSELFRIRASEEKQQFLLTLFPKQYIDQLA